MGACKNSKCPGEAQTTEFLAGKLGDLWATLAQPETVIGCIDLVQANTAGDRAEGSRCVQVSRLADVALSLVRQGLEEHREVEARLGVN